MIHQSLSLHYLSHYPSLFLSFFFFLMIRRPPRSTLFPYTTSSDLQRAGGTMSGGAGVFGHPPGLFASSAIRSEEHTSELQSRLHLVCRLLLEKKKTSHVSSLYPPCTTFDPPIQHTDIR